MDKLKQQWRLVNGLLTQSKCSGQDPHLALLAYRNTPGDAHLCSPAEMLYQSALCTTVPQFIWHKDPHAAAKCDWLDECATLSTAHHDHRGCRQKTYLTVCWAESLCPQQLQDTMAPNHCCMCSWPWLLHFPNHWQWTIQTCTWPHLWMSSRCHQTWCAHHHGCIPSYSTSICHQGSAKPITMTSCSHNTTASFSHKSICSNLQPTDDTCHCACTSRCTAAISCMVDQCNPSCPLPISQNQYAISMAYWREVMMTQTAPGWCQPWWCDRMSTCSYAQWILIQMNWPYLPKYPFHSLKHNLR